MVLISCFDQAILCIVKLVNVVILTEYTIQCFIPFSWLILFSHSRLYLFALEPNRVIRYKPLAAFGSGIISLLNLRGDEHK